MNKLDSKYKHKPFHQHAVLHMIGQGQIVRGSELSLMQIANFMNVSKPTAIKYLKQLASVGLLIISKERRTVNSSKWRFQLSSIALSNLYAGVYAPAYLEYCQKVLRVVLL